MQRRGFTYLEVVVVLGLAAVFAVYLTGVLAPLQRNAHRLEDDTLRLGAAQALAERLAAECAYALPPDGGRTFACSSGRLQYCRPARSASGYEEVRCYSGRLREQVRIHQLVRDPARNHTRRITPGAELKQTWDVRVNFAWFSQSAGAMPHQGRFAGPGLPAAVRVTVTVDAPAEGDMARPSARGVAVARLYNREVGS